VGPRPSNVVNAERQGTHWASQGNRATVSQSAPAAWSVGCNRPDEVHDVWQKACFPFRILPGSLDPPGGILATANARITPDGYPTPLSLEWASPYRNESHLEVARQSTER